MKLKRLMAAMTFVAAGVATATAVAAVDPALPSYTKTSGVSGNLSSVGSDSLANLMTLWAEEFKKEYANVNEQPGSASVVQSISSTINAIGYSGIGYKTSSVRAVALSKKGGEAFDANEENALAGKFPLARFFYVYVNKAPNKPLSPLDAEFVKLVLSKQGQEVVVKDGYIPLPSKVAAKTMKELGLE